MDSTFRDPALEEFDTSRLLANAREQAAKRRYEDFMIVDVDAHHYESDSYNEITEFIEDPIFRIEARTQSWGRTGVAQPEGNFQNMGGRITRVFQRGNEKVPPSSQHRDIIVTRRWMDAMGIDLICLFPTPMLALGMAPRADAEGPRIRSMLYLPFNHPEGCIKMVEDFADKKGVIGFMVTAPRHRGVFDNCYMRLYSMLEERGLPLAFHGGFSWQEPSFSIANKFIVVHA